MDRRRDFFVAAAATAVVLGVAALVGMGGWPGKPSGCLSAGDCSCEAFTGGLIEQPVNTATGIGFIAVGLWVLWSASRPAAQGRIVREPALARLYGAVAILLGIGSVLFHAAMTEWGGWTDLVAMHAFLTLFLLYEAATLWRRSTRWLLRTYAAVNLGLAVVLWIMDKGNGKFVFGTLLVITVVLNRAVLRPGHLVRRDARWFWAGVGIYLGGNVIWLLSRSGGPLCRPGSLLQGHGLWHLAAALAVGCFFLYLTTEEIGVPKGSEVRS